jgi:Co/Zn/Cd efflux system component
MDEDIRDAKNGASEDASPSTGASNTTTTKPAAADDYLTGWKLAAVLAAVTMAAFLMILDLSVVVTVSYQF